MPVEQAYIMNLCCKQVAAYAGLDIAAKVFFGWMVMLSYPILSRQNKKEYAS